MSENSYFYKCRCTFKKSESKFFLVERGRNWSKKSNFLIISSTQLTQLGNMQPCARIHQHLLKYIIVYEVFSLNFEYFVFEHQTKPGSLIVYRFALTSPAGLQVAVLVLHDMQLNKQTCGGRAMFFFHGIFWDWWFPQRDSSSWKRPSSQFGFQDQQWYYVKTCTAWWWCDETLGRGETHVAQPISSELCNVPQIRQMCAVKDVRNNSTDHCSISPLPPLRWIPMGDVIPIVPPPPPASSWHLSPLYSGELLICKIRFSR